MAVPQPGFEDVAVEPVRLGRYVLLDPIANGRAGAVHRACVYREGAPDELLALKRISSELVRDKPGAERFVEVVGRAAQLEHPAHCAILDIDLSPEGAPYVAMELVAGKDLGRVAARLDEIGKSMPPALAAYVGARIAVALDAAHAMTRAGRAAPLYHGDLSPADILIGYDGSVRLTGLGMAELGLVSPYASYRAPELARGGACSAVSDVFALGACLYEVLAGRPPAVVEPYAAGAHGRRRPESHITKVIPRPLEQILGCALAERPEARFASAAELSAALQRWCAAQQGRCDASALAMFMISIFDASIAEEDKRLQIWQARASALERSAAAASPTPGLPAHDSYARLVRASARPAPVAPPQDFADPAEHTPARGMLMRKLAADMVRETGDVGAPAAPVPQADGASQPGPDGAARRPISGLGFADLLSDESWDDDSPAVGWIAASEERANSAPPKPAAPSNPPAAASPPLKLPARPSRAPVPVQASPRAPVRAGAPVPLPVISVPAPAPAAARKPKSVWLAPALAVAGALAAAAALFAALRGGGDELSTLHVRTRPAGAQVFVRGERLGTAPVTRGGLSSGAATLELIAPGFEPAVREIRLEPGKVLSLDVDLIRRAASPPSTAASREADLQAQLAAARLAQQNAGNQSAHDDEADSDRERPRERRADDDEAEPRAVPPADTGTLPGGTGTKPVLELKPAAEPPPAAQQLAAAAPPPKAAAPSQSPTTAAATPPAAAALPRAAPRPSAGPTRAPALLRQSVPRFPARARRVGVTAGSVTIEFTVDAAGAVRDASVVKADPPGLFDETALRAIEKWRYSPKLEAGKPVASRQRFTFRFRD